MKINKTGLLRKLVTGIGRKSAAAQNVALVKQRMQQNRKLHLACGDNIIPGWSNVDVEDSGSVIGWDLRRPLPLDAECMRLIYSEHFVEHIAPAEAAALLRECQRVLEPDGILRVSTPDLRKLAQLYLSGRLNEWGDMGWTPATPARMMNEGMRSWGHQFLYDAPELEMLLQSVGFAAITRVRWGESAVAELQRIESRPDHEELIYECRK